MKKQQPHLFSFSRFSSGQFQTQEDSWRKLDKTSPVTINKLLNSCIQVEETRISLKSTIPCQVNFQLNSDIINRIEQIRLNDQEFTLSPINLTNLRYYVLLNSAFKEQLSPICSFQSSLTFSTHYLSLDQQKIVPVVRSSINLEGQISQQIKQDLWQQPQLLNKVIETHYWLISQIITQLPLKRSNHVSWLFLGLWMTLGIVTSMALWYFLSLNYLLKLLIIFATFYILKISLRCVIRKYLKPWITNQLTHGFLANKYQKRNIGFKILSFIH